MAVRRPDAQSPWKQPGQSPWLVHFPALPREGPVVLLDVCMCVCQERAPESLTANKIQTTILLSLSSELAASFCSVHLYVRVMCVCVCVSGRKRER